MNSAKDIIRNHPHFRENGRARGFPVSGSFCDELAAGKHSELDQGRLMSAFTFSKPGNMWERHPAGKELVMLLSGSAILVLRENGREQRIHSSSQGCHVLVAQNVWHMARTKVPTMMQFLTPGAGREHRPPGARSRVQIKTMSQCRQQGGALNGVQQPAGAGRRRLSSRSKNGTSRIRF